MIASRDSKFEGHAPCYLTRAELEHLVTDAREQVLKTGEMPVVTNISAPYEDLSGLALYGIIYFHCDFPCCSFKKSNLTNSTFYLCDLDGSNFREAQMAGLRVLHCNTKGTRGLHR